MTNCFQGDGYTISYKTYGDRNNDAIVLLPPGMPESAHFDKFIDVFSSNFFIIVVDLPGINGSTAAKSGLEHISKNLAEFLHEINISTPILIGESYGGNVAVFMAQTLRPRKVVLIATGEYFNLCQKVFLTAIFFPSRFSNIVRKLYAKVITVLGTLPFDLSGFTDNQLKTIGQRWDEIIWFKLPKQFVCKSSTLIIKSDKDEIVQRNSFKKLEKIFPNNDLLIFRCSHFKYLKKMQGKDFKNIKVFLENTY